MGKRQIENKILVDVLTGRISLDKGLTMLKNVGSSTKMESVFGSILHSKTKSSGELRNRLFPKCYENIFLKRYEYCHSSLERELMWGKIVLQSCSTIINVFQGYRKQFENYILLGQYAKARRALAQLNKECGHSLWSMEQEFLLNELEYGLEANKKFQEQLNLQKCSLWTKIFAEFFSLKAEKNLNESQYKARVDKRLKYLNEEYKAYFQMHLLVEITIPDKIDWSEVLYLSATSSVIDYFRDYCKVCSYLLSDNESSKELKVYLKGLLKELATRIVNPVLDKMAFDGEVFDFLPTEEVIQKISVEYTKGNYVKVIEECKSILERESNIFEIYEYYIKALIICGKKKELSIIESVKKFDESGICMRDVLLAVLCEVYIKEEDVEQAFDEMYVLLRYLSNFSIAAELYNFYLKKVAYYFPNFWKCALAYQSQFHNIRNVMYYSKELQKPYIDVFKNKYGEDVVYALYEHQIEEIELDELKEVDCERLEWYKIRALAKNGEYQDAMQAAERQQCHQALYVTEYLKEELPLFIIKMKIKLGNYQGALEMLINIYLKNKYLVMCFDKRKFYKQLTKNITNDIKKIHCNANFE